MRFGVTILPDQRWSDAAPLWRRAEQLGFDHAWTFDHISWGGLPDSPWFAAVPTLTAAATVTSRIGLGTFVSTPNNHEPVQFMREIHALDDICDGRFLLGVGAGGDLDAGILGRELTVRQRADRFIEFVRLLDRLSRDRDVTAEGEWFEARAVHTAAGPLRGKADGPRVPLLVAANGPRTIRLVAEVADGWITAGGRADTVADWWRRVSEASQRFDDALAARGRERHTLRCVLNLDDLPVYALTSVAAFEDAAGRAAELGFTDVVVPWPRTAEPFQGDVATIEEVAATILPRLRG